MKNYISPITLSASIAFSHTILSGSAPDRIGGGTLTGGNSGGSASGALAPRYRALINK